MILDKPRSLVADAPTLRLVHGAKYLDNLPTVEAVPVAEIAAASAQILYRWAVRSCARPVRHIWPKQPFAVHAAIACCPRLARLQIPDPDDLQANMAIDVTNDGLVRARVPREDHRLHVEHLNLRLAKPPIGVGDRSRQIRVNRRPQSQESGLGVYLLGHEVLEGDPRTARGSAGWT